MLSRTPAPAPVPARTARLATLATLAALAAAPLAARAQGTPATGSLATTAVVLLPLAVTVTQPLDFGNVIPGSAKQVSPDAVTGGRLEVSGSGGMSVKVTLEMPAALALSGGTATLPISDWRYVASSTTTLPIANAVAFPAGAPYDATLNLAGTGTARIYMGLGATATPAANQPAGSYSATGTITVTYASL